MAQFSKKLGIGLFLGLSFAAHASDFHSPRTAALGGAGHAGPLLNDAIYLNPSYASLLPAYSVSTNYVQYRGTETVADGSHPYSGNNFNLSVQDGRTEAFQAGLGYTRRDSANFFNFGASKAFLQRYGFGLGAKAIFPKGNQATDRIMDGIASFTVIPLGWLQAAAITDNLFETEEGKQFGLYREYILATKVNISGILMVYFDPHWAPGLPQEQTFGHEVGAEITFMKDAFLRFGSFNNARVPFAEAYGRGYGMGIGWIAPRISFDYAYSRVFEPVDSYAHTFGLTIFN